MYAETFGLKPWEVQNTPAVWFARWKFQKSQIDAKTQADMEKQ